MIQLFLRLGNANQYLCLISYRRYLLGILAPALAWPTVFMPYDYALLVQFGGFVGMYFADAQVTLRGWGMPYL